MFIVTGIEKDLHERAIFDDTNQPNETLLSISRRDNGQNFGRVRIANHAQLAPTVDFSSSKSRVPLLELINLLDMVRQVGLSNIMVREIDNDPKTLTQMMVLLDEAKPPIIATVIPDNSVVFVNPINDKRYSNLKINFT